MGKQGKFGDMEDKAVFFLKNIFPYTGANLAKAQTTSQTIQSATLENILWKGDWIKRMQKIGNLDFFH